ncbi:MAG: hypothetical protein J5492_00030 [Oxalobacter sp.]|nr:hypothetical protein [Oxalobacter sp.]
MNERALLTTDNLPQVGFAFDIPDAASPEAVLAETETEPETPQETGGPLPAGPDPTLAQAKEPSQTARDTQMITPVQMALIKERGDFIRRISELPSFTPEEVAAMSPEVQEDYKRVVALKHRLQAAVQRKNGELLLARTVKGVGHRVRTVTMLMQSTASVFLRVWPNVNNDLRALFTLGTVHLGVQEREAVRQVVRGSLEALQRNIQKAHADLAFLGQALHQKDPEFSEGDRLIVDAPALQRELKVFTAEGDLFREIFMAYDLLVMDSQSLQWYGDAAVSMRLGALEKEVHDEFMKLRSFISGTIHRAMHWVVKREEALRHREERLGLSASQALLTDASQQAQ